MRKRAPLLLMAVYISAENHTATQTGACTLWWGISNKTTNNDGQVAELIIKKSRGGTDEISKLHRPPNPGLRERPALMKILTPLGVGCNEIPS